MTRNTVVKIIVNRSSHPSKIVTNALVRAFLLDAQEQEKHKLQATTFDLNKLHDDHNVKIINISQKNDLNHTT